MPTLQALHGFSGPEGAFAEGDVFEASEGRATFLKDNGFAADAPPEEPEADPQTPATANPPAAKPKAVKAVPAAE